MKLGSAVRSFCQALFFPQACVVCGRWVNNADFSPLCPQCSASLEKHELPLCYFCGGILPGNVSESHAVCSTCRSQAHAFDWGRSSGPYQGRLREVIRKFKFGGFRWLAYPLASRLEEVYRSDPLQFRADRIIPVPLHSRRRHERGFDQTLLLSRALSVRLNVPVFKGLRRVRHTTPQFGLDAEERKTNVRGAFSLTRGEELADERLLLVDDVMTTGATTDEIARLVRATVPIREILVLTIARVPLFRSWF